MLDEYLQRIHYTGPREATLATLFALHRAHLQTIPYENLDIHLGRSLTLDFYQVFNKIVRQHRGGWCYEMNNLLAWALREFGFDVQLLSGAVNPKSPQDYINRDHLVLLVTLPAQVPSIQYIADAGFGNAFIDPLPLIEGEHVQGDFTFKLQRRADGYWHFTNHAQGGAGFVFNLQPYAINNFAERCHWLQTSPESGFVRVTVCHRLFGDRIVSLRGAILQIASATDWREHTIRSEAEYADTLANIFDLHLPEVALLWHKVWRDHEAWLRANAP